MNSTVYFAIGVLIGLASVGLFIALVVYLASRQGKRPPFEYDERQRLVRGKAYQAAYWTLLGCMVFFLFLESIGLHFMDRAVTVVVGVCISVVVLALTTMRGDAYLSLRERPGAVLAVITGCTGLNYILGISNLVAGKAVVDGVLTYRGSNLVVAVMGTVVVAALLVYMGRLNREEQE